MSAPRVMYSGLVHDTLRNQLVMVTWENVTETWLYGPKPKAPASFSAYGKGCRGALLDSDNGQLPWLGAPFTLRLDGLPTSPVTVLLGFLGASASQWGAFSLPLDLTLFEMPGCSLLASGDILVGSFAQSGKATWTIAVPADPGAVGLRFYSQWMAVDLAAWPQVPVWTNGGAGQVGER